MKPPFRRERYILNSFADISENISRINDRIGEARVRYGRENDDIRIMAVTKTVSCERVNFAASQGFTLLGENRVQEYLQKKEQYVNNTEIQFIGHLQRNKIKYIIESVTMIQSVDSLALAEEISMQAKKHGRVMDILCEVNIGAEESKGGFAPDKTADYIYRIAQLDGVRVRGLMTIPPPSESCRYFEKMQRLYEDIKAMHIPAAQVDILSMGMSADYDKAIGFGTDMVRLGSALFGARNYT